VAGAIATGLSPQQLRNPELLVRLLGWQNELCGPAFEIAGDTLLLGYKRSVEGLDVNEARGSHPPRCRRHGRASTSRFASSSLKDRAISSSTAAARSGRQRS
jgi:hypothetical protein